MAFFPLPRHSLRKQIGAPGTFSDQKGLTTQAVTTQADSASSVYATDRNGDDRPDVLSAFDDKIVWYENEGSGTFSGQKVLAEDNVATSVYVADLNGDDQSDVLSTFGGKIAWHENEGDGTFSDQKVISTHGGGSVLAKDLNGDDSPDILSAGGGMIAWY